MNRTDVRLVQVLHTGWDNVPSSYFQSCYAFSFSLSLMACKSLPGYFPQSVAQRQYTAGETQRIMGARLPLWISRQKTAALPHIFMLVRECLTLGSVTLGASQCAVRRTTKFHGCLRHRISCVLYRKYGFSSKNISKPQTKQNPIPVSKCTKPGCALLPCHFFVYPVYFLSTETMA